MPKALPMLSVRYTSESSAPGSLTDQYCSGGGQGWTGATTCVAGYTCTYSSAYYSQCVPGTSSAAKAVVTTTTAKAATTAAATTAKAATTAATSKAATTAAISKAATTAATSAAAAASGVVSYAGVNIAGFDFGCGTDGTCTTSSADPPGTAGINQIKHFVTDDGLNAFRLPVSWQFLVNNVLGGTLDATNFASYDSLVQGCLNAGAAFCLIDIHNYARWNGAIIGQGGPTNAQFSSLWSQLATKYKGNTKVAFGIMNEPVCFFTSPPSTQCAFTNMYCSTMLISQSGPLLFKLL